MVLLLLSEGKSLLKNLEKTEKDLKKNFSCFNCFFHECVSDFTLSFSQYESLEKHISDKFSLTKLTLSSEFSQSKTALCY